MHGRPVHLPARSRGDPRRTGRLPIPGRSGPRHLRGQGQEPARPPVQLLPGPVRPAPAHPHNGHHRGRRGVDGGVHRGGVPGAGVLLDQGVQPPLQRHVQGRQVLPLPGGHHVRDLPARPGGARGPQGRDPLLRPLRAGLVHTRDPRPAPAGLPGALLRPRGPAARPGLGAPLPAGLHRQVLRPLRGSCQPGGAPRPGRGPVRLYGRAHRPLPAPGRVRDEGGRRRPGL